MKVAEVIALLDQARLERLSGEIDLTESELHPTLLASRIEAHVKDEHHVRLTIGCRRPPVLALLTCLLERAGRCSEAGARTQATASTEDLGRKVTSGELCSKPGVELYRRVLLEAWRSDLSIDPSEVSLLAVLRRELGLSVTDHFLITHHRSVRTYWDDGDPFTTVRNALEDAGILYRVDGDLVLPEDLHGKVRGALGVPMSKESATRLLERLSGEEAKKALADSSLKTSGSKADRVQRLLDNWVSPVDALGAVHIHRLRDIAEKSGIRKSGSKEELVLNLVAHYETGRDLEALATPEEVCSGEPRALSESGFDALFSSLKGSELSAILWKFKDLRQSGSKDAKVRTLAESKRSEATLLAKLGGAGLSAVLDRMGLRKSGAKEQQIERLVAYFNRVAGPSGDSTPVAGTECSRPSGGSAEQSPVDDFEAPLPGMREPRLNGTPTGVGDPSITIDPGHGWGPFRS